jgi:hypothetical protein
LDSCDQFSYHRAIACGLVVMVMVMKGVQSLELLPESLLSMKPRLSLLAFLSAAFALLLAPVAVAQGETPDNNCFEVIEAMNFAMQGLPEDGVTAISLKDQEQTKYILFVSLEKIQDGSTNNTAASWRLIERQKDSLTYCLAGAGRSLEALASMHSIPGFNTEFGLPGSSKRRCNDESDGALGSVAVRSWANKELGPSLVQAFGQPFRGNAYTVLLAKDGVQGNFPWIILQTDGTRNCYYARGSDSAFSSNFRIRAELIQDPSTLAPLE